MERHTTLTLLAEHDPLEKLVQYDLKNPYFGFPTDSEIWVWKANETYGKLRDLVALVMNMQDTVKDMKVPVDDLAPGATEALLKSLQDALAKADVVTNLKTPDMFREPGDPPAGSSTQAKERP